MLKRKMLDILPIYNIYDTVERKNITSFVYAGEKAFVGVIDGLYLMYEFSKMMALDSISTNDIFERTLLDCEMDLLP